MEANKKKQIEDRLKELIKESNQSKNNQKPSETPANDSAPAGSRGPRVIRRRKGKPDHRIDS
ncbi:MAG: hypothetical protein ACQERN_07100 [Thermodesulfobacteriota bacterium]